MQVDNTQLLLDPYKRRTPFLSKFLGVLQAICNQTKQTLKDHRNTLNQELLNWAGNSGRRSIQCYSLLGRHQEPRTRWGEAQLPKKILLRETGILPPFILGDGCWAASAIPLVSPWVFSAQDFCWKSQSCKTCKKTRQEEALRGWTTPTHFGDTLHLRLCKLKWSDIQGGLCGNQSR